MLPPALNTKALRLWNPEHLEQEQAGCLYTPTLELLMLLLLYSWLRITPSRWLKGQESIEYGTRKDAQ